jgi:outer membrane protein assembly factor BamB
VERKIMAAWGKPRVQDLKPIWEQSCKDSLALAVGVNAVVVAMPNAVTAYALEDGKALWSHPLPAAPVPWGLAANRDGRVIVTLEGGRVICLGSSETASAL